MAGSFLDIYVLLILAMFVYTFFYEIAIGPVSWLYCVEILPQNQHAYPVFVNQFLILLVSFFTPFALKISPGATFAGYSALTFLGGIYVALFMKETKGKTREECLALYQGVSQPSKSKVADDQSPVPKVSRQPTASSAESE